MPRKPTVRPPRSRRRPTGDRCRRAHSARRLRSRSATSIHCSCSASFPNSIVHDGHRPRRKRRRAFLGLAGERAAQAGEGTHRVRGSAMRSHRWRVRSRRYHCGMTTRRPTIRSTSHHPRTVPRLLLDVAARLRRRAAVGAARDRGGQALDDARRSSTRRSRCRSSCPARMSSTSRSFSARRLHGAAGAAVALAGLLLPPMAIVLTLGALYARYGDIDALQRVLAGVAAAAAGLIGAIVIKMAQPLLRQGAPALAGRGGGLRGGRRHALAAALRAARAGAGLDRARRLGAAMKLDTLLTLGVAVRAPLAVRDRRRHGGGAGNAPAGGRGVALDDRPAVRRPVRDRAGRARAEHHRGDADRLSGGGHSRARWSRRSRCAGRPA